MSRIVLDTDVWSFAFKGDSRIGQPIAAQDAWIAACALRHGLPLITHNRDHFVDIPGLTLLTAISR